MMSEIIAIDVDNFQQIPASILKCSIWEINPDQLSCDPLFDKEVWALDVIMSWGSCFQAYREDAEIQAVATFAPPSFFSLPNTLAAGPVSSDAILLSSVRFANYYKNLQFNKVVYIEEELIVAVIKHAAQRGIRAVEAFACTEESYKFKKCRCPKTCFIKDEILEKLGFTVIKSDPCYPRYRIDIEEGIEWKMAVEAALDRLLLETEYTSRSQESRKLMLV